MTQTTDTATAARIARVTVATVRAWCRIGAVAATKTHGRWVVDTDSLTRRVILGRTLRAERAAEVIDLTAFRDAKTAKTKALELVESGAIIPGSRPGLFLAVTSDGMGMYAIDTQEPSCTCKGHIYTGHCYHMVAATLLSTRHTNGAVA
jgi:hypothetical protein